MKDELRNMDYRAAVTSSCWLAVAVISSFYMYLFTEQVGDILFGVFLPVGLLVLVALIVTFAMSGSPEKN